MPRDVEVVVDHCTRFKKPLRQRSALEPVHLALPSLKEEIPTSRWRQLATTEVACALRTALRAPGADRRAAHIDAPMGQHLFDTTQVECDMQVERNTLLNDDPGKRCVCARSVSLESPGGQQHRLQPETSCIGLTVPFWLTHSQRYPSSSRIAPSSRSGCSSASQWPALSITTPRTWSASTRSAISG